MPKILRERSLSDDQIPAQRAREAALLLDLHAASGLSKTAFAAHLNAEIGLGTSYTAQKLHDYETGKRPIPDVLLEHLTYHKHLGRAKVAATTH